MNIRRKLEVSRQAHSEIQAELKCSNMAMWRALSFQKKTIGTAMSKRIIKMAKDRGGRVMVTLPECETIHTHDHHMVQTFSNGAVLDIHVPTGECKVTHNGKEIKTLTLVTIPELEQLQEEIAQWK